MSIERKDGDVIIEGVLLRADEPLDGGTMLTRAALADIARQIAEGDYQFNSEYQILEAEISPDGTRLVTKARLMGVSVVDMARRKEYGE